MAIRLDDYQSIESSSSSSTSGCLMTYEHLYSQSTRWSIETSGEESQKTKERYCVFIEKERIIWLSFSNYRLWWQQSKTVPKVTEELDVNLQKRVAELERTQQTVIAGWLITRPHFTHHPSLSCQSCSSSYTSISGEAEERRSRRIDRQENTTKVRKEKKNDI